MSNALGMWVQEVFENNLIADSSLGEHICTDSVSVVYVKISALTLRLLICAR